MRRTKIIWNITKVCAWDCEFCCVDAHYVTQKGKQLVVKTNCLKDTQTKKRDYTLNRYEDAKNLLIQNRQELSLLEKSKILNNIDIHAEFDFSGGDPLLLKDNIITINAAKNKFGIESISITATGVGYSLIKNDSLIELASGIDITYDYCDSADVPYRPNFYNKCNLKKASQLKKLGMNVTAQIPLTKENISSVVIEGIYQNLKDGNIDKILLMNLFKVGRGMHLKAEFPSIEEYENAVTKYRELELKHKGPKVKLQSGLKTLLDTGNHDFDSSHLNITNMGILLSSPWAYNENGEPLDSHILGDLKTEKLSSILERNGMKYKILDIVEGKRKTS